MATKRSAKAKKQGKETRKIRLSDDTYYEIIGEDEKYWLCEGTQFLKSNRKIFIETTYEEIEEPVEEEKEAEE